MILSMVRPCFLQYLVWSTSMLAGALQSSHMPSANIGYGHFAQMVQASSLRVKILSITLPARLICASDFVVAPSRQDLRGDRRPSPATLPNRGRHRDSSSAEVPDALDQAGRRR